MLAGAQFVGGEIEAGAKIIARLRAANGPTIDVLGLQVTNAELGKSGFAPALSKLNACSRPRWLRKARCQSIGKGPAGACVRDSFASLRGLTIDFTLRDLVAAPASLESALPNT